MSGPVARMTKLAIGNGKALLAANRNPGKRRDLLGHAPGEELPVDGQGTAGRHADFVSEPDDQGVQPAHLFLEKPRSLLELVAPQAIGADELSKIGRLMDSRRPHGPHLIEIDRYPALSQLPGGLASSEATPNDDDALHIGIIGAALKKAGEGRGEGALSGCITFGVRGDPSQAASRL